jgi:multimeric flavodoxin WrbA
MKMVVIQGTPQGKGNTMSYVNAMLKEAVKKGHEFEIVNLYKQRINGCLGCGECHKGTVEYCVQKDDMQDNYRKIRHADCLVIASPIYFGHLTGPMKTFIDRLCTYFDDDFTPRILPGKKAITIMTCGAPAEVYKSLLNYNEWLYGKFFNMELVGNVLIGDCMKDDSVKANRNHLKEAKMLGKSL